MFLICDSVFGSGLLVESEKNFFEHFDKFPKNMETNDVDAGFDLPVYHVPNITLTIPFNGSSTKHKQSIESESDSDSGEENEENSQSERDSDSEEENGKVEVDDIDKIRDNSVNEGVDKQRLVDLSHDAEDGDVDHVAQQFPDIASAANVIESLCRIEDPDRKHPWNQEMLLRYLDILEYFWVGEHITADNVQKAVCHNLGFEFDRLDLVDPMLVNETVEKKMKFPLISLSLYFARIRNPGNAKQIEESLERIYKLKEIICELGESFVHYHSWLWMKKNNGSTIDHKVGLFQWYPQRSDAFQDDHQQFSEFVLNRLHKRSFRRCGSWIYEPIYNHKGQFTYAWNKYCSIETFVWNAASAEYEANMFAKTTKQRVVEEVIRSLKKQNFARFPDIRQSRYLLSFKNGVYNVFDDRFFSYDEIHERKSQFYKSLSGFSGWRSVNQQNLKDRDERAKEAKNNEDGANTDWEQKNENFTGTYINPYSSVGALNYFDIDFDDQKDTPWEDISTDSLEEIFIHQEWSDEKKKMFYRTYGRNWYKLGDFQNEKHQIAICYNGEPNSGKSSLLLPLLWVFPIWRIGIMQNRIEQQWAVHTLLKDGDTDIIIGSELGKHFQMDFNEFKQLSSGEIMQASKKHDDGYSIRPKAPIIFACNKIPNFGLEDPESLGKRLCIFDFPNKIPAHLINTQYHVRLRKDFSRIIQKTNKAYREFISENASTDFWKICGKELNELRDRLVFKSDPLKSFLSLPSGAHLLYDRNKFCSLEDFRSRFYEFAKNQGYHRLPPFTEEYYKAAFKAKGLEVKTEVKQIKGQSAPGIWVNGVSLVPRERAQDNQPAQDKGNTNKQYSKSTGGNPYNNKSSGKHSKSSMVMAMDEDEDSDEIALKKKPKKSKYQKDDSDSDE